MRLPFFLALLGPLAGAQLRVPASEGGAFYWSDFDADGHTDAYVVLPGGRARLLAGQGAGAFVDRTREAGLAEVEGVHQVAWADLDGDRRLDLFLASYGGTSSILLQGEGGGFRPLEDPLDLWSGSRPLDVRALDFDGDGLADLHLVTAEGDVLLRSAGRGAFERVELGFRTIAPRLDLAGLALEEARGEAGLPAITPPVGGDQTLGAGSGPGGANRVVPTPGSIPAGVFCPPAVEDLASGACLPASSVPMLGALYPLGDEFFIEAGSGFVGIGTTTPGAPLDVAGSVRTSGALISTRVSGAPLSVVSSTRVDNLNADLLDGFTADDFSRLGSQIENDELANNSVTTTKIAPGAVISSDIASGAVTNSKLAVNAVGTANIQNGSILDVDVSALAAIQGTKIDPDFGAQTLSAASGVFSGNLLVQDLVASGDVLAGFGSPADPAFTFTSTEPTGISSPFANQLNLLTSGATRMTVNAVGEIVLGQSGVIVRPDGRVLVGHDAGVAYQALFAKTDDVAVAGSFSSAIRGVNEATSGLAIGVTAVSENSTGIGADGYAASSTGTTYGVRGTNQSTAGAGVRGINNPTGSSGQLGTGQGYGVLGVTPRPQVSAIRGVGMSTTSYTDGVYGEASGAAGYGVWGVNLNPGSFGLFAGGNIGATGTKSFVAPHPQDPASEIRFICLEGNEAGTYFRGTSRTAGGIATIEVPDEFRHVSDAEGLTVQVTALGPAMLWVESTSLEGIVVRSSQDVEFNYFVNGVRRGFRDTPLVAENRAYRPTEAGVPFGMGLPDEVRQVLVDNGILNADFTPNEATAAALGWTLAPAGTGAAERASWLAGIESMPEEVPEPVPPAPQPR